MRRLLLSLPCLACPAWHAEYSIWTECRLFPETAQSDASAKRLVPRFYPRSGPPNMIGSELCQSWVWVRCSCGVSVVKFRVRSSEISVKKTGGVSFSPLGEGQPPKREAA